MKSIFLLIALVFSVSSFSQTTVTIDSVVKTPEGYNEVFYSYCTSATQEVGGSVFYDAAGEVSSRSTRNNFKIFGSVWCKGCMTLPCGAGSFTDTDTRKEDKTYRIRLITWEYGTVYSAPVTVTK